MLVAPGAVQLTNLAGNTVVVEDPEPSSSGGQWAARALLDGDSGRSTTIRPGARFYVADCMARTMFMLLPPQQLQTQQSAAPPAAAEQQQQVQQVQLDADAQLALSLQVAEQELRVMQQQHQQQRDQQLDLDAEVAAALAVGSDAVDDDASLAARLAAEEELQALLAGHTYRQVLGMPGEPEQVLDWQLQQMARLRGVEGRGKLDAMRALLQLADSGNVPPAKRARTASSAGNGGSSSTGGVAPPALGDAPFALLAAELE